MRSKSLCLLAAILALLSACNSIEIDSAPDHDATITEEYLATPDETDLGLYPGFIITAKYFDTQDQFDEFIGRLRDESSEEKFSQFSQLGYYYSPGNPPQRYSLWNIALDEGDLTYKYYINGNRDRSIIFHWNFLSTQEDITFYAPEDRYEKVDGFYMEKNPNKFLLTGDCVYWLHDGYVMLAILPRSFTLEDIKAFCTPTMVKY